MSISLRKKVRELLEETVTGFKGKYQVTDEDLKDATDSILQAFREVVPEKREESYYHQNHWKANVYNEPINLINAEIDGGNDEKRR